MPSTVSSADRTPSTTACLLSVKSAGTLDLLIVAGGLEAHDLLPRVGVVEHGRSGYDDFHVQESDITLGDAAIDAHVQRRAFRPPVEIRDAFQCLHLKGLSRRTSGRYREEQHTIDRVQ